MQNFSALWQSLLIKRFNKHTIGVTLIKQEYCTYKFVFYKSIFHVYTVYLYSIILCTNDCCI